MGSQSSKAPRGDVTAEEAAGASPAKANGQVGALGTACPGPLLSHLAPSRALGRGRALCPARDTRRPLPRPVPLFSAPQPPRVKREEGRGGGAGRAPPPSLFAAPAPGAAPRPSRVQRREQRAAPRGRPGAAGWVPFPPGTPSTAPTSVDHGLFSRGSRDLGSLRWVGGSLHKAAGRGNKPSRCGEQRPGAASRPISAATIHPLAGPPTGRPAGAPRQSAGLREIERAPRGR